MVFSKSFSYAVRGILFLAIHQERKKYIQAEEIATALGTPRHFMGKILKGLAKEGVLNSNKGPSGGFAINEHTLTVPLIKLVLITKGLPDFNNCALQIRQCNKTNPCAMHDQVVTIREQMITMLSDVNINDLLSKDHESLMKTISSADVNTHDSPVVLT